MSFKKKKLALELSAQRLFITFFVISVHTRFTLLFICAAGYMQGNGLNWYKAHY